MNRTVVRRSMLAAILALSALPRAAAAQVPFPFEQFSPDTLGGFAARIEASATPSPGERVVLLGRVTKLRVQATYVGERRPLDAITAGIILSYVQDVTDDPDGYAALYREFHAFDDAGRRYWLPVQHHVAAQFDAELKPGQRVRLYALAVGGLAGENQRLQPLLLVQEFDADGATGREAVAAVAPAPAG